MNPKSNSPLPRKLLYSAGIVIVLLWLITMVFLVKKEFLPRIDISSDTSGYEYIISSMPVYRDEWAGVYFQGVKIGYSHTSIYPHDQPAQRGYLIANQTTLILNLLGKKTEVRTRGNVFINQDFRLDKFNMGIYSDRYRMSFNGSVKDNNLTVEIDSGYSKSTRVIPVRDDTMLAHSLAPFLMLGKLKPGERKAINLFDPISLAANPAVINVTEEEEIDFEGKRVKAQAVEILYEGLEVKAWVSRQGEIMRQETSLGWVIVKENREQAMQFAENKDVDLLRALSVPANIALEDPRGVKYLKIKIKGIELSDFNISDTRQVFSDQEAGILEINSEIIEPGRIQLLPIKGRTFGSAVNKNQITAEQDLTPYLESTSFIQSDNKQIIRQAQKIIKDEKDAWAAARLLLDWVYNTVEKVPTFSVPSSVDVLNNKEGDCNEHTYLFTALARSAGIPARVCIGLVYFKNEFYYHAWSMVYVGQWVSMDPTLNQPICDAAHIKLLEGEFADQMKLSGVIGKVKIDIFEHR